MKASKVKIQKWNKPKATETVYERGKVTVEAKSVKIKLGAATALTIKPEQTFQTIVQKIKRVYIYFIGKH